MNQIVRISCLLGAILAPAIADSAELAGYLVDGQGNPVLSGTGSCIRTGSWSERLPGAGCDATPDRVTLLPDAHGRAGAVVVRSASGEKVLDRAYAALEVLPTSIAERQQDRAAVEQRYGALLAAQPPRPVAYTVYFMSGSATELTPASQAVFEQIKLTLASRPAPEITVIGHTDRVGSLESNDILSLRRAEAVRNVLVAVGIRAASLDIAGRGEREPLVATADGVDEVRNRRVEIDLR